MAVCNKQDVILHAVNSVLSQDYDNLELLIGLHQCKDGTASMLNQIKDPRVRSFWYLHDDQEVTLSNLRRQVTGEHVVVMDVDDIWPQMELRRQVEGSSVKQVDDRNGLSVMVVSKDRPFFLKALLDSFKDVNFDLTVLYLATKPEYAEAYEKVKQSVGWARFIDQGERGDMRPHFKEWLKTASDEVMVCPDDNICLGDVDTDAIKEYMSKGDKFGFTLRLHPGISNNHVRTHQYTIDNVGDNPVIEYKPHTDRTSSWGYVWEMSSTFYRKHDMERVVSLGPFGTINELESRGLNVFDSQQVGNMLCFRYAPITNIFVDTGIEGSKECVDEHIPNEMALKLFNDGEEVDVKATFQERDKKSTTHVKKLFLSSESKTLSNKAIVIVPFRNSIKYVDKCLKSIISQTYPDIGIIVADDMSDDGSIDVVKKLLKDRPDVIIISNTERKYVMRNIQGAIKRCSNDDSVIFVIDGDDELTEWTAIADMMEHHKTNDVVWSQYWFSNGEFGTNAPMIEPVAVRKYGWVTSHLRSFKKFLFDAIPERLYLDEDGEDFRVTGDMAFMMPILEMVPDEKRKFHDKILYKYNLHEDNVGYTKEGHKDQVRAEKWIRSQPRVPRHWRYYTPGVTVVVSAYNQMKELQLFMEAMYFQTVSPVEVIIADDGSDDSLVGWGLSLKDKYPFKVTVVERKHEGYRLASLNNLGARMVLTDRILFTNADVLHDYSSIEAHAELPSSTVGAGMIKGIVRKDGIMDLVRSRDMASIDAAGRNNFSFLGLDPAKDQAGVWGGNLSVPSRAFSGAEYDESYEGWGGEDADMVGRLVKNGAAVKWVQESVGYHMKHEFKPYHYESKGAKKYIAEQSDKEK